MHIYGGVGESNICGAPITASRQTSLGAYMVKRLLTGERWCEKCVEDPRLALLELATCDLGDEGTTTLHKHCHWCKVPTEKVRQGLYVCNTCAIQHL